jgi:hypothetical protein
MARRYFIWLAIVICACAAEEQRMVTPKLPVERTSRAIVRLDEQGMPITLEVDSEVLPHLSFQWNADFGRMEVDLPLNNQVFILQDDLDCTAKREELETGIFEISYLINTDSLLVYESRIPEGNVSYWHFFRVFELEGIRYYAENNPLIECSKNDVKLMSEIFSHIRADKPL